MPCARLSHFLDGSVPIYGLRAVPSSSAADITFEGLAKSYVQALRGVQAHGPYRPPGTPMRVHLFTAETMPGDLPDHALHDLGIGRSEILACMRQGRGIDGSGEARFVATFQCAADNSASS